MRTSKDDVKSLQEELETLRRQMRERSNPTASSSSHAPSLSQEGGGHPGNNHPNTNSNHLLVQDEGERGALVPPVASRLQDASVISPASNSSRQPRIFTASPAPFSGNTLRQQQQQPTPGSPEDGLDDTSQVYGATSLLHDQASESPLANYHGGKAMPHMEHTEKSARDSLISNAAIRRQEEIALLSSPSIVSKIDFDGVPADMAMHLLDLHWNRQHLSYLLTYRPAIMDSLINNGPYVNKLLLNSIYLQSSVYSDRAPFRAQPNDAQATGEPFYSRFKLLLIDQIDKPSLPTVVALLTCGACLVPHGRQSAGFIFCGIAYKMITDLGYHLDIQSSSKKIGSSPTCTAIEVEMRKRVYWAAYVGDKLQSLFLGRPPSIPRSAGNVSRNYLDSYEEMEQWKPYVDSNLQPFDAAVPAYLGRPAYALSTFRCLLELCDIAGDIIDAFYSLKGVNLPREPLIQSRSAIRNQLSLWKEGVPSWLLFDPTKDPTPPPHQITPQYVHLSGIRILDRLIDANFLRARHIGPWLY